MTDSTTSAANAAKLEKQLRVLQRKLERSEWHRVDLENQHDRDQHLYRRLQADLEAAHREAQIEAALERVRSRAMAMRSPADLSVISETVFTELKALGFADLRNTEIIINHEAGSFVTSYYYSDYGVSGVIDIDYRTNPIVDAWARAMRTADDAFSEIVVGEDEIEDWRSYRLSLGYAPDPKLDAASVVYHYSYSIGLGALSISSFEPVPAEQLDVLAQFRNVFHLAYQRYADIARAEAQAREAQIQLALERVRTQSMLMQHSSELVATSSVFHEQLLALGIPSEFSYVWLPDEAAGKHQFWATWTTEEDGGPVHQSRAITYDLDKEEPYTAACFAAWESDEKLLVDFIPPADIQRFFDIWEELLGNAEHLSPERYPDGLYYAEGYMAYGCFGINIRREPTEEEHDILRRFAVEFERAYTRFLDLRRAEAQAREAQIEAALERVRSRAMALRSSDELREMVLVILEEMKALAFPSGRCTIVLFDEETGDSDFWMSGLGDGDLPERYHVPWHELPTYQAVYEGWREGTPFFEIELAGEVKREQDRFFHEETEFRRLPEAAKEGMRRMGDVWLSNAATTHGIVQAVGTEPLSDENAAILQRFAKVIDLTYTRVEDIQQAEAQMREAQIELALERVRARTMAMQDSTEISEVAAVLYQQIGHLGAQLWGAGFAFCAPDSDAEEFWFVNAGGILPPVTIPHTEDEVHRRMYEGWQQGRSLHSEAAGGAELEAHYAYMLTVPDVHDFFQGMLDAGVSFPTWQKWHAAYFSHGYLLVITLEPFEEEHVFTRFAKAFEQAYVRFLDLERAEAQAREAEIEAALERVRSRAIAMRTSDELGELSYELVKQVQALGVDTWHCAFNIYDENEESSTEWGANAEGYYPTYKTPRTGIFRRYCEIGQSGADLHVEVIGEDRCADHYEELCALPGVGEVLLELKDKGVPFPESQVDHVAYFKYGYLIFISYEPAPEAHDVFRRFARVFEQAYTRFLDLKQAEVQAREAQIEAALERVRSRAMGMQKSEDLQDIIKVVHDHIAAIGIHADHAGFIIDYKNREDMHIVLVDDQNDVPSEVFIPYFDTPHWNSFRNAKAKGENQFTNDLDFDEKNRFYEQLLELIPGVPDETREFLLGCPGLSLSTVLLDNVGLYIENFSARPYTDEENRTLLRFGNVFQQAYTRYLDLEKAERRAREAQIEAAMERVRSRALAMTTSDELLEVVFKIHQEFAGLGLPCEQFWHTRYTPEVYQKALTGVGGEKLAAVMELPRDFSSQPALAEWERGDEKIGVFTFDADAACTYLHHMITKGRFDEVDPEGITEEMVRENGGFTFVQARTFHGEIGYTLWGETEPSEEAKGVLIRFASAFDLAYRRFEDLQQAEQQAALDRVRAEIASTLTSDADVTGATFDPLEAEIRTLFGRSGLRLGLATLPADGELNVRSGRRIWNSLVIRDALGEGRLDWRGTVYETAMQGERAIAIPDVEDDGSLDEGLREQLLAQGVQSLALQPLRTADRTVGLFELSSPEADAVDDATLLTMTRLGPTFALAVTQNLEGFETRVESALQHAYTAIHPSVRWRFRDAAIEMLERGDGTVEADPVVFEALHPLYGVADIRSSTHHRNEAVRHDALARLGRARDALAAIHQALPLTILDELGLRVRKRIEQYERVWNTGDEAAADRFLTEDVEPVLERMTAGRADLVSVLEAQRASDGESAALRADAYEASRRAINRAVSEVLLAEEAETQRLFPHYFELTRTDGVEHTMYIGPSIAPDRPFDPAYVENLRLRQLITACAVAREVRRLGETLPLPLAIAQLVVVQHAPITLRFRADEKRFDMDSPSGVRFELLKKRLDKACVKGSEERITQPDRVAVVYSTEAEEAEYHRYAEYLAAHEHIEPEFETLDVEDLPGAAGLRMLRLKVGGLPPRPR